MMEKLDLDIGMAQIGLTFKIRAMKNNLYKILFVLIFVSTNYLSIGQSVPQAFSYQGIALDANSLTVNSQIIGLRFTISRGEIAGQIVYSEKHFVETSSIGHFSAEIGRGEILQGVFEDIVWNIDSYFLNVGLDVNGGEDFKDTGTIQFQSVPYALIAEKSTNQPQGLAGEIGAIGPIGEMGDPGPIGPTGPDGPIGIMCFPIDGSPGPIGPAGPAGIPGPEGPAGPFGPAGLFGLPGKKGEIGPEGNIGPMGPTGQTGPNGPPGPAGERGDMAPNGMIGPKGPTGPQGPAGGPTGPQGQTGPAGNSGPSAPQGPQGAKGPDGLTRFVMTNVTPTANGDQNIYLDDGTNRIDGKPGFRYWNGTSWIDIKTSN